MLLGYIKKLFFKARYSGSGFKSDKFDDRDLMYADHFKSGTTPSLPIINNFDIKILNQGGTNACTGFATSYMVGVVIDKLQKNSGAGFVASPSYVWCKGRIRDGSKLVNVGVNLRTSLKVVFKDGVVSEKHYPFSSKYYNKAPSQSVDDLASIFRDLIVNKKFKYYVLGPGNIDDCLLSGYPFVCGVDTNDSFYGSRSGVIDGDARPDKGNHAILVTDKVLLNGLFYYKFANSWGTGWGEKGWGYIPEEYLKKNSLNFWTIKQHEGA